MTTTQRPVTLLIAALGGEGGGVLANWIVNAAADLGLPVQSTSIPGVAQRTGSTTYYIEIFPTPWRELGGKRPVLALAPGVGDIDVMAASELLEAGRALAAGFVTKQRTLAIASTSRFYVMNEKIAMSDGRYDQGRLLEAIAENSAARLLFDMEAVAKANGAMINAVMLGAIAGCGRLPIPAQAFEAAIRADGKAVAANLKGFRAGLAAARELPAAVPGTTRRASAPTLGALEDAASAYPEAARAFVREGVRRLAAYQDLAYARRYLDRLAALRGADGKLLAETARHLAVRMSYEDVVRVAEAKIAPARMARIAQELGATHEPYTVTEFLKPGIEELCALLPPRLARAVLRVSERRGWLGKVYWGMEVNTTSVSGYVRFWLLAKLKRFRPHSFRFYEEQQQIEGWLARIRAAAALSPALALEVAECARLIKGYGDTLKRGLTNYQLIDERVIAPALAGRMPLGAAIDAIASARTAALVDPEGESLATALAAIEQRGVLPLAAE